MALFIQLEFDLSGNLVGVTQSVPELSLEGELVGGDEILEGVADETSEADFERVEKRELLERLMELAGLSEKERQILWLYAIGETFTNMGRKLGITRQAATQTFLLAVNKLRDAAVRLGELPPTEATPSLRRERRPTQRHRNGRSRA
ncbi:MAG: hypothetical protein SLRJCFUN_001577 [Candidatus Fervidibacter sp.]|jgi:DNA-directed RNA polymerase sigma subunit (sigma70/sigma32)